MVNSVSVMHAHTTRLCTALYGLRLGCRVNVFFYGFGVNIEFLACDALAHNTTLFLALCGDSVRGANVSGMDCVGVAV